jgi:tetratricopeptide (TPR) repeat protein
MMTSLNLLSLEVYYRYPNAQLPRKKQIDDDPKPNVPEPPKPQEPAAPKASLDPKKILEEAIEWSDRIEKKVRLRPPMHFPLIGAEQLKIGERKAADESFRRAFEDYGNDGLFVADVAIYQADAGEIGMALKTVLKASPSGRAFALCFIAAAQAQAGDVRAALTSLGGIDKDVHTDFRSRAFEAIVEAQVRSGDINGARETANLKSRLDLRVKRLTSIAVTRHLAGKDDCREILDRAVAVVNDSNEKEGSILGSAQAYIARALAQMGRFTEAFQLESKLPEPLRHYARFAIAIEQAKAKDFVGALKTARSMEPELDHVRDHVLKEIAIVQPDADAFHTLAGLKHDYYRAEGLREIAKRQVAAGQKQQAEDTLRKATEAAHRTVELPGMHQARIAGLRELAYAQGETGFGGAARGWIDRLESPEERVMALIGLAQGITVERAKR